MPNTLLSENQRRHLEVRLGHLLAEAEELRGWAGGLSLASSPWTKDLAGELDHLTRSLRAAAAPWYGRRRRGGGSLPTSAPGSL